MTTIAPARRRLAEDPFQIHEDVPPSTQDTDMNEHEGVEEDEEAEGEPMEDADDQESNYSESSEEEAVVDTNIQHDMEKLANTYPGFRHRYRLIKRIGEGMLPLPIAKLRY
jgi:cell division control protein 7